MTVSTLRPNGTTFNTGALTGGATAHAVLSDDLDSSYVTFDAGQACICSFDDLTLPSGAVLKGFRVRLRMAKAGAFNPAYVSFLNDIADLLEANGVVTWTTPTTISGPAETGLTDTELDATTINLSNGGGGGDDLRVYETYLDVTYVTQGSPNVTAPTGTLTEDTTPRVTWAYFATGGINDFDSDGGPQTHYEVKLFTDAQYGAGGFNPDTSTPHETSGIVASAAKSYQVVNSLPDDLYRAYVRFAQTVNGQLHWSRWNGSDFEVDTPVPADPTISVAADSANARNVVTITQGTSGLTSTDDYQLQASYDEGVTFEDVRTDAGGGLVPPQPKVVATSEFPSTADATTHAIPYPEPDGGIIEDDVLLAFAGFDGNPTYTWPEGWTELKDEAGNGSAVRAGCAYRRAGGGEAGTFDLITSASEGGGVRVLCIRGAHTTTAPEVSTGVSAATANANPDSLNPAGWATENTLWVAAMVNDGNVAVTAPPTGFFDFGNTRWANAAGAGVATAWLRDNAASKDPGAFTQTAEDTRAWTAGVRPAGLITYDHYEAPNGVLATYRVRARHDFGDTYSFSGFVSDTEAWESTSWWLKHPTDPDLNYESTFSEFTSFAGKSRAGRVGVLQPLGAAYPVVVTDTRGSETGQIVVRCDSDADRDALTDLLDEVDPILLQPPGGKYEEDRWVVISDHDRQRVADHAWMASTLETLTFTTVDRPD